MTKDQKHFRQMETAYYSLIDHPERLVKGTEIQNFPLIKLWQAVTKKDSDKELVPGSTAADMRLRSLLTGYARENVITIIVNANYPDKNELVISYRNAIGNSTHIGLSTLDDTIPDEILKFFPSNITQLNFTTTIPYTMLEGNLIERTQAKIVKLFSHLTRQRI